MRWGGPWVTASVRDVSERGMMIHGSTLPPPGSYVDVMIGAQTVTARAIWSDDHTCGLQARSPLDLDQLRASPAASGRAKAIADFTGSIAGAVRQPDIHGRAEASRQFSNILQYLTAIIIALLVSASMSWEVYKTLSAPMQIASHAFDKSN
jgi:hypothetical protein